MWIRGDGRRVDATNVTAAAASLYSLRAYEGAPRRRQQSSRVVSSRPSWRSIASASSVSASAVARRAHGTRKPLNLTQEAAAVTIAAAYFKHCLLLLRFLFRLVIMKNYQQQQQKKEKGRMAGE